MQYQLAVAGALRDRVPEEHAAATTTVSTSTTGGSRGGRRNLQRRSEAWYRGLSHLPQCFHFKRLPGPWWAHADGRACAVLQVVMVVGAGRGPLVRASLAAAHETQRRVRVYAVEKNPNAVVTLHVRRAGCQRTPSHGVPWPPPFRVCSPPVVSSCCVRHTAAALALALTAVSLSRLACSTWWPSRAGTTW